MVVLQHAKLLASLLVGRTICCLACLVSDLFQVAKSRLAFAVVRVEEHPQIEPVTSSWMDIVNASDSVTLPAWLPFLPLFRLLVVCELRRHVNIAQFVCSDEIDVTSQA